jgi:hypothetical protein
MREHTLYVTEHFSGRVPRIYACEPKPDWKLNSPAQDQRGKNEGYQKNAREHTTVCDRAFFRQGSPFFTVEPPPEAGKSKICPPFLCLPMQIQKAALKKAGNTPAISKAIWFPQEAVWSALSVIRAGSRPKKFPLMHLLRPGKY